MAILSSFWVTAGLATSHADDAQRTPALEATSAIRPLKAPVPTRSPDRSACILGAV
jgi:hypothetical protein